MIFEKLKIDGAFKITHDLFKDHRGAFGREFCIDKFSKILKKKYKVVQTNISFNKKECTLRGFHYQKGSGSEEKIITLLNGAMYDIIVDLRKKSKTYKKWVGIKINEKKITSIFIPKGCANAFLTLKKNSIVHYITNKNYNNKKEDGVRFDDPFFNFRWPKKIKVISKKDLRWKNYELAKKNK